MTVRPSLRLTERCGSPFLFWLDTAIKEYLTSLDSDALDDIDHRRLSEILAFTTNLEHAGDIVEKSLMPLAAKRIRRGVSFSEAAREEIREMIDRLISNARAAAAVFITEDPRAARQLLGEKEVFREIETRTTEEYFGRALRSEVLSSLHRIEMTARRKQRPLVFLLYQKGRDSRIFQSTSGRVEQSCGRYFSVLSWSAL